jgi:uncharacterized membrane protein
MWLVFSPRVDSDGDMKSERLIQAGYDSPKYNKALTYTSIVPETSLLRSAALIVFILASAKGLLMYEQIQDWIGFGCNGVFPVTWLGISLIQMISAIAIIISLRHLQDDYDASLSLLIVSGLWISIPCLELITMIAVSSSMPWDWNWSSRDSTSHTSLSSKTIADIHSGFMLASNCVIFTFTALIPLYRSYEDQCVTLWSSYDSLDSLDALLKDIVCIKYFKAYLSDVQAAEYILCWVEIELFKDMVEVEEDQVALKAYVNRLFDKYLDRNSELEVKMVSIASRKRLANMIEQGYIFAHTFDEIQEEIYQVMHNHYPR